MSGVSGNRERLDVRDYKRKLLRTWMHVRRSRKVLQVVIQIVFYKDDQHSVSYPYDLLRYNLATPP